MNYANPPDKKPHGIMHETFYSRLIDHEIGYNIYLPPEYKDCGGNFPVAYHVHGWKGNESSEIWPMEKVYGCRRAITVFMNAISTEENYLDALYQMERVFLDELIPHVETRYRTETTRENRMLSGFSMGGNMAFYYAVKHPELFGSVTPYAGTYHHLYHKEYRTVGVAPDRAAVLFDDAMREKWDLEDNNILSLVRENADRIRGAMSINIHIGTADILFCDNEIMHLYLESLKIPHGYWKFEGVDHDLAKII